MRKEINSIASVDDNGTISIKPNSVKRCLEDFSAQLHRYIRDDTSAYQDVASKISTPTVTAEKLMAIARGDDFASMDLAVALANTLNIQDRAQSLNGTIAATPRSDFLDAAYEALSKQPLQRIIECYMAEQKIDSTIKLSKQLGCSEIMIRTLHKKGSFSGRELAISFASALNLSHKQREKFLKQFGGFYASDEQVITELEQGDISLAVAIKNLIKIRGKQNKDFFHELAIPETMFRGWTKDHAAIIPDPKYVRQMAGNTGL